MTTLTNLPYSSLHRTRRLLDVCLPEAPNGACIVFVHGGGWKGGTKESWQPVMEHCCGLGYVCASAEYRLCPEVSLRDMLEDLRLAVSFVKQHAAEWGFNPARLAAYGSSAGGHLVGMLATIRPEDELGESAELAIRETVPQAVVAMNPALALQPIRPDLIPPELLDDWPAGAGSPEPQERLTGHEPPFLIVVGDADDITPLTMQQEAAAKLQAAGVRVELVIVPGAKHGAFYGVTGEVQQFALPYVERFLAATVGAHAAITTNDQR